jgi:hypothetical protein
LHETLGIRNAVLSRPPTHGPHARVPTLRRSRYRDRRKARYRLGRAHPWPGRIFTCWTTNEISWSHRYPPIPIDQHRLVASMHQRPGSPNRERDFPYAAFSLQSARRPLQPGARCCADGPPQALHSGTLSASSTLRTYGTQGDAGPMQPPARRRR